MIEQAIDQLLNYVEAEEFRGYDPYDTLLSPLPFHWFGKWGPIVAIQLQKRNPLNIRPLLGIRKAYNPKAMGLFLQTYVKLWQDRKEQKYLDTAHYLFNWLRDNRNTNFSGASWGYNFPWAGSLKYLPAHVPSSVVTGFVARGIYDYYQLSRSSEAAELLHGAAEFVMKDLAIHQDESGVSISYTPLVKDVCYNASLLAAEVLAMDFDVNGSDENLDRITAALDFVVHRQHPDGRWDYSEDLLSGKIRVQTDFHQGYILESLYNISVLLGKPYPTWTVAIQKGLSFYKEKQFLDDGSSLWRLPKRFPIDIHNQSQGIITLSRLREFDERNLDFAEKIANYSMQLRNRDGSFIYRRYRFHSHRIPYIRWNQAWMLLALTTLQLSKKGIG